ncbi:MAG TPA: tryptophan--tRNA ligase, partial [Clostridia bacterium]|nr:tryptophan--tRNA ligase [Clostridia bacterium]
MIQDKKVVYSATQPTGCITLGNYIGAIKNWLKLNEEYFTVFAIADLHALTIRQVPADFRKTALSFFAQYLALGLNPETNILYFQSHVPQHAELAWILNCFTYVGEASRMTQFKEKSAKHADNINMGLMDYPVLMAADILLYRTDLVPVGIDQKQHLELTRDLAIRFNNLYSPTFAVPEPYIGKQGAKI